MKMRYALSLVLAGGTLLGAVLTGCGLASAAKPVAVIASPPSGTQVDANSDVQFTVNATDSQGIVRIDLMINGAVVTSESAPTAGGQPTFSAVLHWTPTTPGQQVVQVLAYNVKGDSSAPVGVNIMVRQAAASADTTPTGAPTSAPSPSPTAIAANSDASVATDTPQPAAAVVTLQPLPPAPQTPHTPPPATQTQQPQQKLVQPALTRQPQTLAAPSNFKVDNNGLTISFNWTDNSTNESGFRIYKEGASAPLIIAPANNNGTGIATYNWGGLSCGFSATYYVRAFNDSGESASSNSQTGLTLPCAPTSLSAQFSGKSIMFNWAVATQHDEAGFRIYEQGNSSPVASRGPNLGSGGTNLSWTGLNCNILGTFTVRAYNAAGESGDSNAVQAETIPCAPTNPSAYNISKFDFGFSFMDNSTNEAGFHVYEDDKLYVPMSAHAGTGIVKTGFSQQCNQTHLWSLKAYNSAGESDPSSHLGVTTPSVCN